MPEDQGRSAVTASQEGAAADPAQDEILVFGLEGETLDRGVLKRAQEWRAGRGSVKVEALAERTKDFLRKMERVFDGVPQSMGGYDLEEITLALEVTAKGEIGLLGTGGEFGGSGGITFTLQRRRLESRES